MSCAVKTYPKQVLKTSRVRAVAKLSTTASAYRWGFLWTGDPPQWPSSEHPGNAQAISAFVLCAAGLYTGLVPEES